MIKNEKGITLIALVVTIIILLILAGVSITTLSGDGLFGRAESSAAKYEQASAAENSTLTSLMDKYDNYENLTNDGIIIRWNAALSHRGSFINDLTPDEYRNDNFKDKQIVAVYPNGTKVLLNPYVATSVTVPVGTKIQFCYYRDKNIDGSCFYAELDVDITIEEMIADGKLVVAEWTPKYDTELSGYFGYEEDYVWGDDWNPEEFRGKTFSDWSIDSTAVVGGSHPGEYYEAIK